VKIFKAGYFPFSNCSLYYSLLNKKANNRYGRQSKKNGKQNKKATNRGIIIKGVNVNDQCKQ